jgi:hypothetical protein
VQPEPVGQLMPEVQLAPVGQPVPVEQELPVGQPEPVGASIVVIKGRQLAPGQVTPLGQAELVMQPL